jgi:hypothetical protein
VASVGDFHVLADDFADVDEEIVVVGVGCWRRWR